MEEADLDMCGGETRQDTASYGEAEAGVTDRFNDKPVVTKGGNFFLLEVFSASGHINKFTDTIYTGIGLVGQ